MWVSVSLSQSWGGWSTYVVKWFISSIFNSHTHTHCQTSVNTAQQGWLCVSVQACVLMWHLSNLDWRLHSSIKTYKCACTSKPPNHKIKWIMSYSFRCAQWKPLYEKVRQNYGFVLEMAASSKQALKQTRGPVCHDSRSGLQRNRNHAWKVQNTLAFQSLTCIIRLQSWCVTGHKGQYWKEKVLWIKKKKKRWTKATHFESVRH